MHSLTMDQTPMFAFTCSLTNGDLVEGRHTHSRKPSTQFMIRRELKLIVNEISNIAVYSFCVNVSLFVVVD